MNKIFKIILGIMSLALVMACERETLSPDPKSVGYAYFPLEVGFYQIYEVDRINYNFASKNDTLRYEQKNLVADYFINQEGDTAYYMQKLIRNNADEEWKLDSVWHVVRTPHRVVLYEDNKPVIKLVFPLEEGKNWDSNFLNTKEADEYKMTKVHKSQEIGESTYDATVTVVQEDIDDIIVETDIRNEVYAANVGLVYKKILNLRYCTDPECLGKEIVNSGTDLVMVLKEYGKE